ncbi:MAG: beta galactosidase jelly roll domain-containing protein [Clostridia bacterium]|nr:beta galactosidase jelly roll domain-containing protein [Clostridia bacterium]
MNSIYSKVREYYNTLKSADARQIIDFSEDWQYSDEAISENSEWHKVSLPHDYSVRQGYFMNARSGLTGGYVKTGIVVYQKQFTASEFRGKVVNIRFDGVASHAKVYINGHFLGQHPYPFTQFEYNMTPFLRYDSINVVKVICDTSDQPYSRFYIGTGIYRKVYLIATDQMFMKPDSVFAKTIISNGQAQISVSADVVANTFPETVFQLFGKLETPNVDVVKRCDFVCEVNDLDGNLICSGRSEFDIENYSEESVKVDFTLPNPKLWSIEEPNLYVIHAKIYCDDKLYDDCKIPLGIREISCDKDKGFFLNNKHVKLKGMCIHQDIHAFGNATNLDAWVNRLLILKEMGCNSIRTAHHPFPAVFYMACDYLGFTVIDEAFDEWKKGWYRTLTPHGKMEFGYYQYFDQWFETDLSSMITRDRNFPSVIMYSFGNEIPELYFKMSEPILHKMQAIAKALDDTRPTTVALEGAYNMEYNPVAMGIVDIAGFNYVENRAKDKYYEIIRSEHPEYVLLGSETVAHPKCWYPVRDNDYVLGQYVWTAFDYLGEAVDFMKIQYIPTLSDTYMRGRQNENEATKPLLHGWPNSIIGISNTKKPDYYFRKALWSDETVVKLAVAVSEKWDRVLPAVSHYNFKEGEKLSLYLIYNCDEVVLKQNGIEVYREARFENDRWIPEPIEITYVPGELELVGYKNGEIVACDTLKTAGAPADIKVTPDYDNFEVGGYLELSVEIVDENGTVVPGTYDFLQVVETEGCERFAMVSDNLYDSSCHDTGEYMVFEGRCKVIIKIADAEHFKVNLKYADITKDYVYG